MILVFLSSLIINLSMVSRLFPLHPLRGGICYDCPINVMSSCKTYIYAMGNLSNALKNTGCALIKPILVEVTLNVSSIYY